MMCNVFVLSPFELYIASTSFCMPFGVGLVGFFFFFLFIAFLGAQFGSRLEREL